MNVVLFARAGCPYCAQAEACLKGSRIDYTVVDITGNEEQLRELSTLTGDPVEKLTVPKIVIDGKTVIRSSEELQDLSCASALQHIACGAVHRKPSHELLAVKGAVCVMHTGPKTTVWLAELENRLVARGASVQFVDMESLGATGFCEKLGFAVVVNRVSDAVPPALARFVISFMSLCESQGIPVVNGAAPYSTTTSKIAQHGFLLSQGLSFPHTVAVRGALDVRAALPAFHGKTVLFKPNAGSFGSGIVKFDDMAKLQEHANRDASYGNDGIALLQEYHHVSELHRVFVLDGQLQCGVTVTLEDVQFTGQCMASAQKRQKKDGASSVSKADVPHAISDACIKAMAAARADVGSVEYLIDAGTGKALFYDINLLSTYPSPALVGVDCWDQLAAFILKRAVGQGA